jgi:hypothetical protein
MSRPMAGSIAVDAFFDNFAFAALFGKLRIPGSPREIVDSRQLSQFDAQHLKERAQNLFQAEKLHHDSADSWNSNETPQTSPDNQAKPALNPLEKLHQSR